MRLAHLPDFINPARLRALTRDHEARTESAHLDTLARAESFEALKVTVADGVSFYDWTNALDGLSEARRKELMHALAADDAKTVLRLVKPAFDACVLLDATDLANRLQDEARS